MKQSRNQPPQHYLAASPSSMADVASWSGGPHRSSAYAPPTPRLRTIPLPHDAVFAVDVSSLLAFKPYNALPIVFNAEYSHAYAHLRNSNASLTTDIRRAFATTIAVSALRLWVDGLPWGANVPEASPGAGVRVDDVLSAVTRLLYSRVYEEDMMALGARRRAEIVAAFHARTVRAAPGAEREGIQRIDWLRGRTLFMGLVPTADPQTFTVVLSHPT